MPISKIKTDGIQDAAVTTAKVADDAVNSAKIGVDVIAAEDLAANSITVSEISDDAVTSAKIATGAVIADGLGNDAVTSAKIATGAVVTDGLGANAVTTAKIADTVSLGRRNLMHNSDMKIAQRGDSVTAMGSAGYFEGPDRFRRSMNQSGGHQVTRERIQEAPAGSGLTYSLKETITTAGNEVNNKWAHRPIDYRIEGQDVQHLLHGTSNAKPLTLSFWVRSNKTGTASVQMTTYDSSSGSRHIAPRYTINSANTWEYKTITVVGDTGGSGIKNDHNLGLGMVFYGAAGPGYQTADQSSAWGPTGDNWWYNCTLDINNVNDFIQFAGLQLEVGDTATPFEHRTYREQLTDCQRYLMQWNSNNVGYDLIFPAMAIDTDDANATWQPPVTMRATPSYSISDAAHVCLNYAGGNNASPVNFNVRTIYNKSPYMYVNMDLNTNSLTTGQIVYFGFVNSISGAWVRLASEL